MKKKFTLIEVMIVVAIIAIIAVIAIPGFVRAKISTNETSSIGTLRSTATAQLQIQKAALKDRDFDGIGEYAYYGELAGEIAVPRDGTAGTLANPAFISSLLGTTAITNAGVATKSGYLFRIYLPSGDPGLGVIADTGAPVPISALQEECDAQELRWGVYTWPNAVGKSGNRAFAITQTDEVIATANRLSSGLFAYSGMSTRPDPGDAFNLAITDFEDQFHLNIPTTIGSAWSIGVIWTVLGKN